MMANFNLVLIVSILTMRIFRNITIVVFIIMLTLVFTFGSLRLSGRPHQTRKFLVDVGIDPTRHLNC